MRNSDTPFLPNFGNVLILSTLAFLIWMPLLRLKLFEINIFAQSINVALIITGFSAVQFAYDFRNFYHKPKLKHFLFGALLAPVWLGLRWFILRKATPETNNT